ncbi:MAG: gliding motility-associated C-terminal domain-containing protein [Bacteroidales bacterium]|nr:gliding motility-associated C-terminal domain-containing protein [Bacteroidales bacterium]
MKTLKEQFENYEVPVDEAGWESIIQDKSVVKYNRGRMIRRGAMYGAATLAVASIVTVAVLFSRPQRIEPSQTSEATENVQEPARQEVAAESAPVTSQAPAHAHPQAAPARTTSATAPVSTNVPADNMTAVSATPASIPAQTPPAAAKPLAPQPAPATPASAPQPTPAPTPIVPPKQVPSPTPTHNDTAIPSAPKAEPDEAENPTPQPQSTNKTFFAPNAFSPNGDGINDVFYVFANVEYTEFELNIYSRNGDHVFQSRNIENGWNGRRNGTGELLPQGVYVYTIKYKTVQHKSGMEKGQILLLQ